MLFDDPNRLSNEEIREILLSDGFEKELVESIIEQFWFHDWGNSFISFKKHFQLLQEYLKEEEPSVFNRFDYYTYFYQHIIHDFEKKKEFLEKLSLVFELMQTDQLLESDFEEVLKHIKASVKLSINELLELKIVLVNTEEGKKSIKWVHHTLTEYLAAEYILNKDSQKTLKKFMVYSDFGITSFIPSWTGTLRFLIEKEPNVFVKWIIRFIIDNPDSLDDQLAETVIFSTPITLDKKYHQLLFKTIFNSYQEKKWWLPVWVRHYLFKFIDNSVYKELKTALKKEDNIVFGNIIATVDGMLQNNHPFLSKEEKQWWRAKFIKYANVDDEVGVLRRHSLAALENYKGESDIIELVESNSHHSDSLVRQAFINMCKVIDPNASKSIAYFVKAIEEDSSHIYARHALYEIDSKEGISLLLNSIAENSHFIHQFLDKESIFNKNDERDKVLIDNIRKYIDDKTNISIKKIILTAFATERNYDAGRSYFLQELTSIVHSYDSHYLYELVEKIKNLPVEERNHVFVNDIEGIIAVILRPTDLSKLQKIFTKELHPHAVYNFEQAIYLAPKVGNPRGKEVVSTGIKLGIIKDPKSYQMSEDFQKQQDARTYNQFRDYLNPPIEGQYYPQVFRYFIESQRIIEKYWNESEREKLLNLAISSNLERIDPQKIKVRYKDRENKTGEYVISSVASYFGDILQVIYKLKPSTFNNQINRQKVLNFLPYLYGDYEVIEEILGKLSDEELTTVNNIMLDKNNDARYLIPQTYIYFADKYSYLQSPKKILMSFVEDPLFSESDREYALRILTKYLSKNSEDEKFIQSYWNTEGLNSLSNTANAILISVFHNQKAVKWRFEKIKTNTKPFRTQEGAHSVGDYEMELNSMSFAKTLIELNDERYLENFIDLLNFSLNYVKELEYQEYVNYIWRIAIGFVIRENFLLSHSALKRLKEWAYKNQKFTHINWFNRKLDSAVTSYLNTIQRKKLNEAIKLLKELT